MKQRYTVSSSLLKPLLSPHVLLIQVLVHGHKWRKGSVFLKKVISVTFIHVQTFSVFYVKSCLFLHFLSVTIVDQAYVKSISIDRVIKVCFLEGKNFVRGECGRLPRRRMDMNWLGYTSVVEHLISDAGVPCSNSQSGYLFPFNIFDMCISFYMSIPPNPSTLFI